MRIFSVDRFWKFLLWLVVSCGLLLPFLAGRDARYWSCTPLGDKVMYVFMTAFGWAELLSVLSVLGVQSLPYGVSIMVVSIVLVVIAWLFGILSEFVVED